MFVELMLPKQMLFYKNAAKNAQLHIQGVVLAEPCLKLPGKVLDLPIYMPASFKNLRPACKAAPLRNALSYLFRTTATKNTALASDLFLNTCNFRF